MADKDRISGLIAGFLAGLVAMTSLERFSELRHKREAAIAAGGRGRNATSPYRIPAAGWRDVLWRVYNAMFEDRIMLVAAGITFYALLALFPAITALISVYGLFADPTRIAGQLQSFGSVLPGGAMEVIGSQLQRVAGQSAGSLGLGFFIGLGVALWSANSGVKSVFEGLNVAYGEDEKRSFLVLLGVSMLFTVGAMLLVILGMFAIAVVPVLLSFIGFGGVAGVLMSYGRWVVLLGAIGMALALLYRYGPSRDAPQWIWVTPGSIAASLIWIAGSAGFSWYVANFGSYNKVYGSLGAAIGFMVWMWLSAIIVLLGGELNAELEHQTRRDTTQGEPEPMHDRGARMADTLGETPPDC